MHWKQIVELHAATTALIRHKAVLITINKSVAERDSVYDAVHYAWKLDPKKARKAQYVLAVAQGLIVGGFEAKEWLAATVENFLGTIENKVGRWGFVGSVASNEICAEYLRCKLPDGHRKKGASNPVRYLGY